MALGEEPWARTLCAFAGVAALGASAWRVGKEGASRAGLAVLTTSLYGAVALAVFSVASAPSGFDALSPGSPTFAGMTLWAVALATVVAGVATRSQAREAHPQAAPVVETLAHAVVACGALAGAISAFVLPPGVAPWVDLASAFTPVAAALAFFVLQPRRRALVHPAVLALALAGVLLARLGMPDEPRWWMVGVAAVGAGLLLVARLSGNDFLRFWLLGWGVVLSLASLALSSRVFNDWGPDTGWPEVAAGALVAVAAHLAGGYRWRALHYLGGLAVFVGVLGGVFAMNVSAPTWTSVAGLTLVAGLYGLTGLLQEAWMRRTGKTSELLPLDDLSLAMAALGVLRAQYGLNPGFQGEYLLPLPLFTEVFLVNIGIAQVPLVLASVLLLLRARRDRSRLVSTWAAWGLALPVVQFSFEAPTVLEGSGSRVLLLALLALGFSVIAMPRGRGLEGPTPARRGRKLLGWVRLPFPEWGRPLYTDGFATVALVVAAFAALILGAWVALPVEPERPRVRARGRVAHGQCAARLPLARLRRVAPARRGGDTRRRGAPHRAHRGAQPGGTPTPARRGRLATPAHRRRSLAAGARRPTLRPVARAPPGERAPGPLLPPRPARGRRRTGRGARGGCLPLRRARPHPRADGGAAAHAPGRRAPGAAARLLLPGAGPRPPGTAPGTPRGHAVGRPRRPCSAMHWWHWRLRVDTGCAPEMLETARDLGWLARDAWLRARRDTPRRVVPGLRWASPPRGSCMPVRGWRWSW